MPNLAFIIPTLNEAANIERLLHSLQGYRQQGHTLIVVDGGSADNTVALSTPLADQVLQTTAQRAAQMNLGAANTHAEVLVFLHADSVLPAHADQLILQALSSHNAQYAEYDWGRFDVQLSGQRSIFKLIACLMNLRSRITGIATGDQCIFITAKTFRALGGYPAIPLMEDIALSVSLKQHGYKPACLTAKIITSSRRWEQAGIVRTILHMWWLRLSYFLGADPTSLAKQYYPKQHKPNAE